MREVDKAASNAEIGETVRDRTTSHELDITGEHGQFGIDRRTVLKSLAASSAAGILLGGGTTSVVAKPIGTHGQLQLAAPSTAPDVAWTYSRGDTNIDRAYVAVETTDGFVFAGRKTVSGTANIWVVKATRQESTNDFRVLWDETFGPGTAVDMVEVGGDFVVVSSANSGTDVLLVRVGDDGTELWRRTYDGGESRREIPSALIRTTDGGFAVTGRSFAGQASTNDAFLLRTDANGDSPQFTRYENSGGIEIVEDLVQAPDGGFVLAGRETVSGIGKGLLLKADNSGSLVWRQVFGDPGQLAFGIALAPNGYALTTADGFVLSDASGNTQSPVPYASGLRPTGDILATADGGYALAGSTIDNEHLLLKVDADGAELWRATVVPPSGGGRASSVAETDDGGFLLGGETSANGTDAFVIRFRPQAAEPGSVQGYLVQTPANDVDDTLTVTALNENGFRGTSTLDCEGGSTYAYYTVQRQDSTGADEGTIRLYVPEGSLGFATGSEWRITAKGSSIGCGGAGLLDPVTLSPVNTTFVDGSAVAGEPVEIPLDEPVTGDVTLDSITLKTTTDTDYTLAISTSETAPEGTTPLEIAGSEGTVPLGYITIDESLAESDIAEVVFVFRVSANALETAEINSNDVALYRYDSTGDLLPEDQQPTTSTPVLDETTNEYVYQATSPGLSVFAIGAVTNESPTASFSYDPTDPEVEDEITFDASASADTDGTIESYAWDFGDGTTATEPNPTHAYDDADEYTVTLTVTDDDGATSTAEKTVTVVVFANPLVNGYVPQDLDGDGLYEDVNGDGVATGKGKQKGEDLSAFEDVIAAYDNGNGDLKLAAAQVDALNFDRDGRLTGADVGELNKILKDKDKEKDKSKDEKNKK